MLKPSGQTGEGDLWLYARAGVRRENPFGARELGVAQGEVAGSFPGLAVLVWCTGLEVIFERSYA